MQIGISLTIHLEIDLRSFKTSSSFHFSNFTLISFSSPRYIREETCLRAFSRVPATANAINSANFVEEATSAARDAEGETLLSFPVCH